MKTLIFAASLAAASIASPSIAQPAASRVAVSTAGLDLATAQGQRALDLRILHAVSALCGTPSPADRGARAGFDACRGDALAAAAADRDHAVAVAQAQRAIEVASNR